MCRDAVREIVGGGRRMHSWAALQIEEVRPQAFQLDQGLLIYVFLHGAPRRNPGVDWHHGDDGCWGCVDMPPHRHTVKVKKRLRAAGDKTRLAVIRASCLSFAVSVKARSTGWTQVFVCAWMVAGGTGCMQPRYALTQEMGGTRACPHGPA